MLSLPTQYGRYRLIQALGSGDGVFLAVGESGAECILRRPPSDRRLDPEFLSRFQRAAHLSRRLVHDGLVAVHDVGEVDGEPYLAEEFVEGHDLAELLRRCASEARPIPVAVALHIGSAASRALGFLHEFDGLDLVHRKLGPARIRVGYDGGVKVLDLVSGRAAGADSAFRPAFLAEELPYLAPEQLTAGPIDARADIYALGVVLWETLAGRSLLSTIEGSQAGLARATREEMIDRVRTHRPPPPSRFNAEVRADVDALVMRALAQAPDARFARAGDLERALAPLTGQAGRDATARLMNRLFDASRERDERTALRAAAGRDFPGARAEPPPRLSPSGSSVADMRGVAAPAMTLASAPVRARSPAAGTPVVPSRSVTTIVPRNAQWLRRFSLIFGVALAAAVVFNIYMTRHLDREAAAASAQEAALSGQTPLRQAPAVVESSAAVVKPIPSVESPAPRPSRVAESSASVKSAVTTAGTAEHPADLPAGKPRQRAGGEGKKLLAEARAAFEHDDFSRAILLGRAALAAGEGGAHDILGSCNFKLGRYQDALREYAEAARLDPNNPALARKVELARRAADRHAEGPSP